MDYSKFDHIESDEDEDEDGIPTYGLAKEIRGLLADGGKVRRVCLGVFRVSTGHVVDWGSISNPKACIHTHAKPLCALRMRFLLLDPALCCPAPTSKAPETSPWPAEITWTVTWHNGWVRQGKMSKNDPKVASALADPKVQVETPRAGSESHVVRARVCTRRDRVCVWWGIWRWGPLCVCVVVVRVCV
eukprot:2503277-Rhodomonas_salina.1